MKDELICHAKIWDNRIGDWKSLGLYIPEDHPLYHNIKVMVDTYNKGLEEKKKNVEQRTIRSN